MRAMVRLAACFFALLAAGLALPAAALAWGPATHLELSTKILENLGLLPLALQELLAAHPLDFLYGSIAADIVAAKKFSHYLRHCHRWAVGLEVLAKAEKPPQKSFAWGYLSHLAADVVAHNYFVPYKTILSFNSRAFNHAYWEVRFDACASDAAWKIPHVINRKRLEDDDRILKEVLSNTLLSFQTNKVIFNGVILAGRFNKWREIVGQASAQSKMILDPKRVERYKELSANAILSFLIDRENAWCFQIDPTGRQSLKAAAVIRCHIRRLYRKGRLSRQSFKHLLHRYRSSLEENIYAGHSSQRLVDAAFELLERLPDVSPDISGDVSNDFSNARDERPVEIT